MNIRFFDVLAINTAAVSRRSSQRLLAATPVVAALATGLDAQAKNGRKRRRNKRRNKKQLRPAPIDPATPPAVLCAPQVAECRAAVARQCAPFPDPEVCEAAFAPCCPHLRTCDAASYCEFLLDAIFIP